MGYEALGLQHQYVLNETYGFKKSGNRWTPKEILANTRDGEYADSCQRHLFNARVAQKFQTAAHMAVISGEFRDVFACKNTDASIVGLFGTRRLDGLPVLIGEYNIDEKAIPSYGDLLERIRNRRQMMRPFLRWIGGSAMILSIVIASLCLRQFRAENLSISAGVELVGSAVIFVVVLFTTLQDCRRDRLLQRSPVEPPPHEVVA
jgi:hypothetical protein